MNYALAGIIIAVAAVSWWVSGYDRKLTGHDKAADLKRRLIWWGLTVMLVGFAASRILTGDLVEIYISAILLLPITPFWVGCLLELSTQGLRGVLDPDDDREFDPKESTRNLDHLASLIRDGRNDEAIALCHQLLNSNEISSLAMDTMLDRLYHEKFSDERIVESPFLTEAKRLCNQNRFAEAVAWLDALLARQPGYLPAILFRMQIQTRHLNYPGSAHQFLQTLENKPGIPPGFVSFARHCIAEWSRPVSPESKSAHGIESLLVKTEPSAAPKVEVPEAGGSVDDLLASGNLTAAIETLEKAVREHPEDFESSLKLAKAHGHYCQNIPRARKLIDKIAANPSFTPEQIQRARSALQEWEARH
ncbi:MAG TPA: tetratricopeptide repeat protein [Candidatus Paceibacterota bacterium]|nr:tetratricopeptide repeat protein [Candidatus Paceibacterota bacterium]